MESKFKKYTLLHNPRCRKSREGLEYLISKEIEFETIIYLKNRLNKKEIESLINKSGLYPMDLIRKQEKVWKELYKSKKLSKNQVIQLLFDHPTLLHRPFFITKTKAVLAKPPQNILEIL